MTPRTSIQVIKRMDCHFLQWGQLWEEGPSPFSVSPATFSIPPFPSQCRLLCRCWLQARGQEGHLGLQLIKGKVEQWGKGGVWVASQLTAEMELLFEGTGPASGKHISVQRGERDANWDPLPGDEAFSSREDFGVWESLWPQLRLNKSPHHTSSPTACLAKEHKLSL